MSTEAIEQASAIIRAHGTARQRELRAYYLARGRFADLITLASVIDAQAARHLAIVAA